MHHGVLDDHLVCVLPVPALELSELRETQTWKQSVPWMRPAALMAGRPKLALWEPEEGKASGKSKGFLDKDDRAA